MANEEGKMDALQSLEWAQERERRGGPRWSVVAGLLVVLAFVAVFWAAVAYGCWVVAS